MASWTSPKTWAVGEKVRAADLNAQVRDNLTFLHDPPRCAVRIMSSQSIPHSTDTTVQWTQAPWDSTGEMWDDGSPSKVLIQRAGLYLIVASVLWADVAGGKRAAFLHVNGDRRRGVQHFATEPTEFQLVAETNLAVGDELELQVRQGSGSAINIQTTRTVMSVTWQAAAP